MELQVAIKLSLNYQEGYNVGRTEDIDIKSQIIQISMYKVLKE